MVRELPILGRLGRLGPGGAGRDQTVLSLCGTGYRAAIFHLGALTRLNELGLLAAVDAVGAVSGGSILAAFLAARVPWPLSGAYRDWPEQVTEPVRRLTARRALLRNSLFNPEEPGLEERFARQLARSLGRGDAPARPRFVFGGSGLALAGMSGWEPDDGLEWRLDEASAPGYDAGLVREVADAVGDGLEAVGPVAQAVLENHGYLLADGVLRSGALGQAQRIEPLPPEPPHPTWIDEAKVRESLRLGAARPTLARWVRARRRARARPAPEPASAELRPLLERYRPLLQYDSLESYRADSVATIAEMVAGRRCNSLHRADGRTIAATVPAPGQAKLDLSFLGAPSYADGQAAREDDYLDEAGGSHADDARLMRRRAGCADLVYGRARHDRDGRLWLQYWLFFYFNDKGLLGVGAHEGDWEMIQLRLGDDLVPDEVTYGQHSGGERASWDEVERDPGEELAPLVYVSRGSHACRLRRGSYRAPTAPDHNDGLGPRLRPRLVTIGDDGPGWVLWPGRWGSTRRREAFEGESPRGPRHHPQWWDPAAFHASARPASPVPPGTAAAVDDLPQSPQPELSPRLDGERIIVSYRFRAPAPGSGEPWRIVAAPLLPGDDGPQATHSYRVGGRRGAFAMQLPRGLRPSGIRACAASRQGIPGDTAEVPFE